MGADMPRKEDHKATPLSLRRGSTDSASVQRHYDAWADSYDQTLQQWQYQTPNQISALLQPGMRLLDVGCGTGLLGRALRDHGDYQIDGIDISPDSLTLARQSGDYAQLLQHDLQSLPLPVSAGCYDGAACVGVLTYIEDGEALLRDLCRGVRPGGVIAFSQRSDLWQDRDFPGLIGRLQRDQLWIPQHISKPRPYLPGNEDFAEEIKVILTLCRRG